MSINNNTGRVGRLRMPTGVNFAVTLVGLLCVAYAWIPPVRPVVDQGIKAAGDARTFIEDGLKIESPDTFSNVIHRRTDPYNQ